MILHATLTMKDGTVVLGSGGMNGSPWGQLTTKTNFGDVEAQNDLVVFNTGDPTQSLGETATITATAKDNPAVTTTLTLPPDYSSSGLIEAFGNSGDSSSDCGEHGQRGADGPSLTVTLSELRGPAGRRS